MQWISVNDRLPRKEETPFLVVDLAMRGGEMVPLVEIGYLDINGNWVNWNDGCFPNVTHWMPLPEPPATEAEGE